MLNYSVTCALLFSPKIGILLIKCQNFVFKMYLLTWSSPQNNIVQSVASNIPGVSLPHRFTSQIFIQNSLVFFKQLQRGGGSVASRILIADDWSHVNWHASSVTNVEPIIDQYSLPF